MHQQKEILTINPAATENSGTRKMKTTYNYRELEESGLIQWGDTTAFVYDEPSNRYLYSSGEISDVFDNVTGKEQFVAYPWEEASETVRATIMENMLAEFKPADGVADEGYQILKSRLESGDCSILEWEDETGCTTYMLCL